MDRLDPFSSLNPRPSASMFDSLDTNFDDSRITDEAEPSKKDQADFMKCIKEVLSTPVEKKSENKTGYACPPIVSQFKKGDKSGPGRPKGAKSNSALIKQKIQQQAEKYGASVIESLFFEARVGRIPAIKLVLSLMQPKTKTRTNERNGQFPVFSRFFKPLKSPFRKK